jgi:hypothetical protein
MRKRNTWTLDCANRRGPPYRLPISSTGHGRVRIVQRQAYVENADDLTPEELDQAVSRQWRSRARDFALGKPVLPPNVCPVRAAHIPGHLVECGGLNITACHNVERNVQVIVGLFVEIACT